MSTQGFDHTEELLQELEEVLSPTLVNNDMAAIEGSSFPLLNYDDSHNQSSDPIVTTGSEVLSMENAELKSSEKKEDLNDLSQYFSSCALDEEDAFSALVVKSDPVEGVEKDTVISHRYRSISQSETSQIQFFSAEDKLLQKPKSDHLVDDQMNACFSGLDSLNERVEDDSCMLNLSLDPLRVTLNEGPISNIISSKDVRFLVDVSAANDDPFVGAILVSEEERRRAAWLPSESTLKVLLSRSTILSEQKSVDNVGEQLTRPGLVNDAPQGDPVRDLLARHCGEQVAMQRRCLSINDVSQDQVGIHRLIASGSYRAALDLTGRLLAQLGQGVGRAGQAVCGRNTTVTLTLWQTRLALLLRTRQYALADSEALALGSLDSPDLYFEYTPMDYPGRRGSMVPFALRLLHAELPQYTGKSQEALDRLYYLLAVVNRMLSNLKNGYAEDGAVMEMTEDNRKASVDLWQRRKIHILYSIGNTLVAAKDLPSAMQIYTNLMELEPKCAAELHSLLGRLCMQIGDLGTAAKCFQRSSALLEPGSAKQRSAVALHEALLALARADYESAKNRFRECLDVEPSHTVAVNNFAVCCLYLGQLHEAIRILETLLIGDPNRYLHEGLIFNLCTLYELESSKANAKKARLLETVARFKGDGFNVSCVKLPVNG